VTADAASSPLLAVPNLSIGPDPDRLAALEAAFASAARLLDTHSDATHGRTVLTLAGAPDELRASLLEGARAAIGSIDLNAHAGAHPNVGALDVAPIVHPEPGGATAAARLARELGAGLGELGLAVFLYGALARSPERVERHQLRRGGIVALRERMAAGELRPDFGPSKPHPTAGAVLVTARPPLAAFNVELEGLDPGQGRELAAALRESGGGLEGVRAIAIALPGERLQISTNVHDPAAVPLRLVVAEVRRLAQPLGARAVAAELVGLVPAAALAGFPGDLPFRGPDPAGRTIEGRLRSLAAEDQPRRQG
jgi:glutamate formiminotransferase/glutamate formiminotransferase/formiminotetrahydrofolate cyclodeaminase